jgi:hypothetical protein
MLIINDGAKLPNYPQKSFSIQSFLIAKPKIFRIFDKSSGQTFLLSIWRSFSSFENKLVVVVVNRSNIGVKSKLLIISDLETNFPRTRVWKLGGVLETHLLLHKIRKKYYFFELFISERKSLTLEILTNLKKEMLKICK